MTPEEKAERRREVTREASRRFRERHPDRVKAQKAKHRETEGYRETNRLQMQRWREANRERWRELVREDGRRRRAEQPEAVREYMRAWREANPDARRTHENRRRAGLQGDLTIKEWQGILEEFDHRCAYCQAQGGLTQDHITPISRGGRHTRANVVPACGSCNSSKGAKTLFEFAALVPIKMRRPARV